jgi:predicted outer membrane protein
MALIDLYRRYMYGMPGSVETAARLGKAQKKRKLIAEYSDKVPAEDKEIFKIAPELYIQTKLKTKLEKPTLSREVLAVYNKMKGLTGEAFDKAYENLSKAEKSLYKNKIEGNTDYRWDGSEMIPAPAPK